MFRKWLTFSCTMLLIAFSIQSSFAQESAVSARWSKVPEMMQLVESGQPMPFSQAQLEGIKNFENPNKTTRVINGPYETYVLPPSFRVHPSTITWQSEVPITRHPTKMIRPRQRWSAAITLGKS